MNEVTRCQVSKGQGTIMMNTYQNLQLHEWIAIGRETGKIRDVQTVILAYCMDEREALAWIADIVRGDTSEQEALVFMTRVIQYMQ
jgi:hydroxymethylpyrimidine pyrophosphatase-like HAD family hydrolase